MQVLQSHLIALQASSASKVQSRRLISAKRVPTVLQTLSNNLLAPTEATRALLVKQLALQPRQEPTLTLQVQLLKLIAPLDTIVKLVLLRLLLAQLVLPVP